MNQSAVLELWRREQAERHRKGLCVACGIPLGECWCGWGEPEEYRPVSDGSDGGPE